MRADLETAVLEAIEKMGPAGLNKLAIAKPFMARGGKQSTLYRWIDAILESGKPGQHVARKVKEAAEERAARVPDPVAEVVEEVAVHLPTIVPIEVVGGGGGKTVNVLERLNRVMSDIELLVGHAKTDDGKVRNSRLLLQSSAELRKCLETSVKFYQAMRDVDQVNQLHAAILAEIRKASPEMAEAILRRIDAIAASWAG
jgi:hypothetical protein